MSQDILQKKEWNTKQVATVVVFAISITFTLTMIWNRFLYVETENNILSERLEKKDARLNKWVSELEDRVKILELPNTDKE